jgi:hypothetical protein
MYLIKSSEACQTALTEADAIKQATYLVHNNGCRKVEIYKLCKVIVGEFKISITGPGVVREET